MGTPGLIYTLRARVQAIVPLVAVQGGTWLGPNLVKSPDVLWQQGAYLGLNVPGVTAGLDDNYLLNATQGVPTTHNVTLDYWFDFETYTGDIFFGLRNFDGQQYVGDAADTFLSIDGTPYEGIIARLSLSATDYVDSTLRIGGGIKEWVWSGFAENIYAKGAEQ